MSLCEVLLVAIKERFLSSMSHFVAIFIMEVSTGVWPFHIAFIISICHEGVYWFVANLSRM